jgi:hypothetical protein
VCTFPQDGLGYKDRKEAKRKITIMIVAWMRREGNEELKCLDHTGSKEIGTGRW